MKRSLTSSVFAFVPLAAFLFVGEWVSRGNEWGEIRMTFNKDVAPILFKNCVQCHRPGEVAPMSLLTFKEARPWARSIKDKVIIREMPPWHADARFGQFANDRKLGQKEIDTIVAWVDGGANEGDPADLPPADSLQVKVNGPARRMLNPESPPVAVPADSARAEGRSSS